ncbi:MAG TPA: pantoate--beta-alanine ligase [Candidatus Limnocylindrales bacterium]|nr:pantoate--beta-alanine ligase [Candidatus Limnocylindrales bacterium]
MRTVRTVTEIRDALRDRRGVIGLVPTMGAFHDGHLSLMRAAREACDVVVVSLFVNPSQFNAAEDLARYPRDEAADALAAETVGADLLFAPDAAELYPDGFDTWVEPGELATVLEGAARPGHFRAVATVCTKLLSIVRPDLAYFGRKDAQQVAVIKRVVADLNLPLEIVALPTVRDADGLALSSRNAFLSPAERAAALALPRALHAGAAARRSGADPVAAARTVLDVERGLTVDYVDVAELDGPTLVAAVRVGTTRLIDNVSL